MNPMVSGLDDRGMPRIDPAIARDYLSRGWWGTDSLADLVRTRARRQPNDLAIRSGENAVTWGAYDSLADAIAEQLVAAGLGRGATVAVLLPDGIAIHGVLIGARRAGVVTMGIGSRSGDAEVEHLLRKSTARALITAPTHRGRTGAEIRQAMAARGVEVEVLMTVSDAGVEEVIGSAGPPVEPSPLGPNEISMLNSTSGTTGLPKCVTQYDNRWIHFSRLAIEAGGLQPDEMVLSVVPTPFGFGLWTSHYLGPVLGVPTIVLPTFSADEMIRVIERDRVTVLNAVTTQFRMMLGSAELEDADLSSLRVMFTGGEAIPVERATEFEERTGARLLQFFGSNETGAVSCTTLADPREKRLTTGGRLIAHMEGRIVDERGMPLGPGERGAPACRGPLNCAGYFGDDAANEQLYTADGWMLMGDVATVDAEGYLTLVGRTSDIIIRGGKNISAAEVENAVETHPDITLVSVVPVADALFGERVCAVITVREGSGVTLESLARHLESLGISREWWPERLLVIDEMPRNAGGKIAKAAVRDLVQSAATPAI